MFFNSHSWFHWFLKHRLWFIVNKLFLKAFHSQNTSKALCNSFNCSKIHLKLFYQVIGMSGVTDCLALLKSPRASLWEYYNFFHLKIGISLFSAVFYNNELLAWVYIFILPYFWLRTHSQTSKSKIRQEMSCIWQNTALVL